MHIPSRTLIAFSAFLNLILALPTFQSSPAPIIRELGPGECPGGKNFYVCQLSSFRGCCSLDPCGLATGCPDTQPPAEDPPANDPPTTSSICPSPQASQYIPELQTIFPSYPDLNSEPTTLFNVSKGDESTTWEQIMTFKDIPTTATNCQINWGVPAVRDFTVEQNGQVDLFELTRLPDGPVTANSVAPLVENVLSGQADFTFWPETLGAHKHIVKAVECKFEMSYLIRLANTGKVFLRQDSETGWYLSYSC